MQSSMIPSRSRGAAAAAFFAQCRRSADSRPGNIVTARSYSAATTQPEAEPATAALSPRWLSDVKQRIGHCITWGLSPEQTETAGQILQEITRDWRELLAGSEGYLTDQTRRGLFRREVAWGELDSMGHVNNTNYNRWAETARVNWAKNLGRYVDPANRAAWEGLVTPKGDGLILKRITMEFKFPLTFPDHITVYHKLTTAPSSSPPGTANADDTFIFHAVILSERHQRVAARCEEENVLYDYRVGRKVPLRPFMRAVLEDTWRRQVAAQEEFSARVRALLERVRALERESWDRPGAVESFGSS